MTNEKSTAKTKDEMRWAMVHAEEARVLALVESLPNEFRGGVAGGAAGAGSVAGAAGG